MRRSSPALLGLATLATLVASLAPLAPARADHRAEPPSSVFARPSQDIGEADEPRGRPRRPPLLPAARDFH